MKSVLPLALLACLAGVSAALAGNEEGDPANGADAFRSHCARCHKSPDSIAKNLNISEPESLYALDEFLATHHTDDATMRSDIIAFLLQR